MITTISDSKTKASIDSLGAQLISLTDNKNKEYIWQRDPSVWSKCSPLLFPVVGNSRDGRTCIEGQWYEMPKHGFCTDSAFQLEESSESGVVYVLCDSKETLKYYPYKFRLTIRYTLADGSLVTDYTVKNTDTRPIYYCIGTHPGFICPLYEGESFHDYILEFEKAETVSRMVYDLEKRQFNKNNRIPVLNNSRILPLCYEIFDQDAVYFDDLVSRKVSILNPKTGKGLEVAFPDFETVAFWTPADRKAPLICVEPWNGTAICSDEDNEFIHKNHLQSLAVGEEKSYRMEIRIL